VTIKIEIVESQLATDDFTNDKVKEEYLRDDKKSLNNQLEYLQNQLQSLYDKLPKGINIYKYFYFVIYVISSTFLLYNLIAVTHFYNI
jgi:hypothetical protein